MKSRFPTEKKGQHGFGLVEVMVAMVIGMIGIIIMMQVFAVAEGQKRSTTGTGDAQNNGALALYTLQRDIRLAGYGFNSDKVFGCALTRPDKFTLTQLAPVIINSADVPDGDDNTDTLLVAYGSSAGSPEGDTVKSAPTASGVMGVQSPTNFAVDDMAIAAPSAPLPACTTILKLAKVSATSPITVTLPESGAVEGGALFNLGRSPRILAYAIRSGNLTVCDYLASDCSTATNYTSVASNIVSLRAEYYDPASTATSGVLSWSQTTPATACAWSKTTALRIALIARNSQFDKDELTELAPVWEGSGSSPIDLSERDDWQHYRYKVFETVIPLRNLPWMGSCS